MPVLELTLIPISCLRTIAFKVWFLYTIRFDCYYKVLFNFNLNYKPRHLYIYIFPFFCV